MPKRIGDFSSRAHTFAHPSHNYTYTQMQTSVIGDTQSQLSIGHVKSVQVPSLPLYISLIRLFNKLGIAKFT